MIDLVPIVYYLAGPYSGNVPENIRRAQVVAGALRRQRYHLVVPHNENIGHESVLDESGWLEEDLILLGICGGIILLPGWENSRGTLGELRLAKLKGLRIATASYSEPCGWRIDQGETKGTPWPANQ